MLTTRINGSLGSALQTCPKENMTHCSGTFFIFNHPHYTEVGGFQGDKKNFSFCLPQIYEVWCLHFMICLVQISYSN